MKHTKIRKRRLIRYRIRKTIKGTANRPRLSIFRSNKAIYGQVINDLTGETLASASSIEDSVPKDVNKTEQAKHVGKMLGERMMQQDIKHIVFDRSGYLYHGRVKALADGAREAGLKF